VRRKALQSIRWRLAGSYALLVLLSVTLMGALALYIVQRYVGRQESVYLKANAEAVADLAERFFEPQLRRVALEELASTSAFLGTRACGSWAVIARLSRIPATPACQMISSG